MFNSYKNEVVTNKAQKQADIQQKANLNNTITKRNNPHYH